MEPAALGGNRQVSVTEATDEIERFARRFFVCETHRVGRDALLDGLTHVRRCTEEAVCWNEARERLMRALKVVGLNEELNAAVAIGEVGKDGA